MKHLVYIFTLILSSQVLSSSKVLWWNIGYNQYSLPSSVNLGQTQLDDTLQNYDWQKYNIVSFGEFVKGTLHPKSLSKLKSIFRYRKLINYNDVYGKSLYIFSKNPFNIYIKDLDWAKPSFSQEQKQEYKNNLIQKYGNMDTFIRKYIRITTTIFEEKVNFIFYHLNNPWPKYYKKIGKIRTAAEILLGYNNPLFNQVLNMRMRLVEDFGEDYDSENIVMMGDSNCPKDIKGLLPACYALLKDMLTVVEDIDNLITFPARSSKVYKKFPSVKIDHVQVTSGLIEDASSKVLKLIGSDHYALELNFL